MFAPHSGRHTVPSANTAGDRTILNLTGTPGTGSRVVALNAQGQLLTAGGATQINGVPITIAQAGVGASTAVAYLVVNPNAHYIQAGPGARTTAGRNTLRTNGYNEYGCDDSQKLPLRQ